MIDSDKTIKTIPRPGEKRSEKNPGSGNPISAKKLAANRRNAKQSTGPKTKEGKRRSRRNSITYGLLTSVLLIKDGDGTEDAAEFARLFTELRRSLAPDGALEAMVVESIAVAYWRARRSCGTRLPTHRRADNECSTQSRTAIFGPETPITLIFCKLDRDSEIPAKTRALGRGQLRKMRIFHCVFAGRWPRPAGARKARAPLRSCALGPGSLLGEGLPGSYRLIHSQITVDPRHR